MLDGPYVLENLRGKRIQNCKQLEIPYRELSFIAAMEATVEVGDDAVFTLSSAKSGNGVEQLRDNNTDTFWQVCCLSLHTCNRLVFVDLSFISSRMALNRTLSPFTFTTSSSCSPSSSTRISNSTNRTRPPRCVSKSAPQCMMPWRSIRWTWMNPRGGPIFRSHLVLPGERQFVCSDLLNFKAFMLCLLQ
jgi:hypothetical protein